MVPGPWCTLVAALWRVACSSGGKGRATYRYLWGSEKGLNIYWDEYVYVLIFSMLILVPLSWISVLGQFKEAHFR